MKNQDLDVAIQMEVDATLDLVSSKEKLVKTVDKEIISTDLLVDTNIDVSTSQEKLIKSIKDEIVSTDLITDTNVDIAAQKEAMGRSMGGATKSTDEESKLTDELNDELAKRIKTEEALNAQTPIVDYSDITNKLNESIAKALDDKLKVLEDSMKAIQQQKQINDQFNKQAEKDYASHFGMFKRVTKSLEKTAKTSESGLARMSSKMILGAKNFVAEKVDNFLSEIPIIGRAYKVGKFVRSNMQAAKETRVKKKVRERAGEYRSGKREMPKEPQSIFSRIFEKKDKEDKKKQTDKKNEDKEKKSSTEKIISLLGMIQKAMMFTGIFSLLGSLITGMGSMMSSAIGTIAGVGGKLAGLAAGVAALKGIFTGKKPDIPTNKPSSGKQTTKPTTEPDTNKKRRGRPPKQKPEISDTKSGKDHPWWGGKEDSKTTPDKVAKKTTTKSFEKLASKTAKKTGIAAVGRFLVTKGIGLAMKGIPFVGAAMTAYDIYDYLEEIGKIDDVKKAYESGGATGVASYLKKEVSDLFAPSVPPQTPEQQAATEQQKQVIETDARRAMAGEQSTSEQFNSIDQKTKEKEQLQTDAYRAMVNNSSGNTTNNIANVSNNTSKSSGITNVPAFNPYQSTSQRGTMIQR